MTSYRWAVACAAVAAAILTNTATKPAAACTRSLYVGDDGTVITGRNMDWKEDMGSNLYIFPAGMKRDGASGPKSITWTSKYGSVVVSGYEVGTTDGMNEKGLVANLLYLAESEYSAPEPSRPFLSISAWTQFVLDNYATVAEAVDALRAEPFNILAPTLPNGAPAALHLSMSDATGDSAILEYVGGRLVIHHSKEYTVMTNSPVYDQQLALNAYWKDIGGLTFMPGTNRAADRFVRTSFLHNAIPRKLDQNYIAGVPQQSYAIKPSPVFSACSAPSASRSASRRQTNRTSPPRSGARCPIRKTSSIISTPRRVRTRSGLCSPRRTSRPARLSRSSPFPTARCFRVR
jgi:penicillin V acylase-like amidase (Ntn superfamily)